MTGSDGQVINPSDSGHSISVDALPLEALRGILNKLNEKSQTSTRLYNRSYEVRVGDVKQLILKVDAEFHACTIISKSATVSLLLGQNERHDFGSWAEFDGFDSSQSIRTSSLQIELTYDVLRNSSEVPERYRVQVSVQNLSSGFGIVFGPISISQAGQFPVPPAPISVTVRYNNYILGKNILGAVSTWESSLNARDKKVVEFFQNHSSKLAEAMFFTTTLAGFLFAFGLIRFFVSDPQYAWGTETWVAFSGLALFIFAFSGKKLGKLAENYIDRQLPLNNITLTRGDEIHDKKVARKNKRKIIKSICAVFVVAGETLIGIWSTKAIGVIAGLF